MLIGLYEWAVSTSPTQARATNSLAAPQPGCRMGGSLNNANLNPGCDAAGAVVQGIVPIEGIQGRPDGRSHAGSYPEPPQRPARTAQPGGDPAVPSPVVDEVEQIGPAQQQGTAPAGQRRGTTDHDTA